MSPRTRLSVRQLEDRVTPTTLTLTAPTTVPVVPAAQSVPLTMRVADGGLAVDGGTVTYSVIRGFSVVVPQTKATVVNGAVTTGFTLPANAASGSYAIQASFSGAGKSAAATAVQSILVGQTFAGGSSSKGSPGGGTGGNGGGFDTHDPNDLTGPAGVGPHRLTRPDADWSYELMFQNDGTGAARDVIVTGQLDPNLDPASFRFDGADFGSAKVDVPAGQTSFLTVVPHHNLDGSPLNVPVGFDFDAASGRFRVEFHSLDPATSTPYGPGLHGLLPPDDSTHVGTGHVRFSARPRADLQTGAEVRQAAEVVFDANEAERTPTVLNTVDAVRATAPPPADVTPAVVVRAADAAGRIAVTPGAFEIDADPVASADAERFEVLAPPSATATADPFGDVFLGGVFVG